jgi:hypothetical protein
MKPILTFRFNTGRMYQPKEHEFAGQVIDVEVTERGIEFAVRFWDRSRHVNGAFVMPCYQDKRQVREEVMAYYDTNTYTELDYFDYLERQRMKDV